MRICSLLMAGHATRRETAELVQPEVREEVCRRLSQVGLELVDYPPAPVIGVRPSEGSRLEMGDFAAYVLVLLWKHLIVDAAATQTTEPRVSVQQMLDLYPPLRNRVGKASKLRGAVTFLHNLDYANCRGDVITPGPQMWLLPHEKMAEALHSDIVDHFLGVAPAKQDAACSA